MTDVLPADPFPRVTLANFGGGILEAAVEEEGHKLWTNINDINRDREAKRTLSIELIFEPSANDRSCATSWKVSSKLAPLVGASGSIYVMQRGGEDVGVHGPDMKQTELDWREADKPRALHEDPKAKAAGQ